MTLAVGQVFDFTAAFDNPGRHLPGSGLSHLFNLAHNGLIDLFGR